jgi:hypothetical protein
MKKLQIDGNTDLYKIINFIKNSKEDEINVEFLNDSIVHKNASNINILKKHAESLGKRITFGSENPALEEYLRMVEDGANEFSNTPMNFDDEVELETVKRKFSFNFKDKFAGFTGLVNKPSIGSVNSKSNMYKILGVLGFVIVLMIIGVWSFLIYVPRANVKLIIDSDIFIKLIDVKADSKITTLSVDTNVIPAMQVTAEDSETKTIDTTGKKLVGDKASGEVTITNKKNEKIKIKKGAKLKIKINDKTLVYLAAEDKEISAASEVVDTNPNEPGDQSGTVYGSGKLKVEAEVFGTQHNIDKDKTFDVEGHKDEDVYGKNEKKLDGGSSKEVQVVAQADLDLLKKSVEDSIKEKFKDTLRRRLSSGQVLSEGSIVLSPAKAEYSAKLDEEIGTISLTATYSGKAFSYNNEDLDKVINANITKIIPANFKLSTEKPEYDAIPVNSPEDGVLNIQVKLRSSIVPSLDIDKIKEDISGMKLEEAQAYLNALPNVKETSIELTPNLPASILRMPKRPGNINITI